MGLIWLIVGGVNQRGLYIADSEGSQSERTYVGDSRGSQSKRD